jgi:hypothetical protein
MKPTSLSTAATQLAERGFPIATALATCALMTARPEAPLPVEVRTAVIATLKNAGATWLASLLSPVTASRTEQAQPEVPRSEEAAGPGADGLTRDGAVLSEMVPAPDAAPLLLTNPPVGATRARHERVGLLPLPRA